jgi:excisionase family DNA binding protein
LAYTRGMTVKQAAEQLGMARASVRRLLAEGRLKGRKFGDVWEIEPASVAAFTPVYKPPRSAARRAELFGEDAPA